jgi:AraC-like DNA-binding protein
MENRANSIVLVRAEYVILYIDLLRRLGTPVDRELRRARLPTLIEEMPDAWVSMDLTFRFIANCARAEGIDDIGFESTLQAAPTPKSRLEVFSRLLSLEDTGVHCELHPEGDMARICMPQYTPHGADSRIAEWLNLKAVIEVIRSWMGPDWLPPAIGLASRLPVSHSIRDRLPGIQILTGQSTPFIGVPSRVLSMPIADDWRATVKNRMTGTDHYTSIVAAEPANLEGRLSAALTPYLASGHPPVGLAAEIAGTSVRSLQRRLDRMQTSYTELVERLRFEQAVRLLRDSDLKILEVAIALGYGDASNFTATPRISLARYAAFAVRARAS